MNRAKCVTFQISLALALIAPCSYASDVIEKVKVEPLPFDVSSGVRIECIVADDSPALHFEYRWAVNDEVIPDVERNFFPGSMLQRGDEVAVMITPITYAGDRLEPFISQSLEVANALPKITSEPAEEVSQTGYRYLVKAEDPDGDKLGFELLEGPDGMTVDERGQLRWEFDERPPADVYNIKIAVVDGFGGRTEQAFMLDLSYGISEEVDDE